MILLGMGITNDPTVEFLAIADKLRHPMYTFS